MSDIMHKLLGEKRMVYAKKKEEPKGPEFPDTKLGHTAKHLYELEDRVKRRAERKEFREKRKKKAKIMNPKGFYEDGRWSVRGIKYVYQWKDELNAFLNDKTPKCMKIVSQGLLPSDPRFFEKIIYMIRHPREVAKSHENLQGQFENAFKDGKEQKPHSPRHYIAVTTQAAKFFLENPDIPVLFCQHADMLKDPETHVKRVAKFLGLPEKSSWNKAKNVIEPKLHRSKPQDIKNELWETAEKVFELFNAKDFQGVLDFMDPDPEKKGDGAASMKVEADKWFCPRRGTMATKEVCVLCLTEENTRKNFRESAERKGINWKKEPCVFETGFDASKSEDELKTIRKSIRFNHWQNFTNI
jgi:hypothetical protein